MREIAPGMYTVEERKSPFLGISIALLAGAIFFGVGVLVGIAVFG